MSLWTNKDRRTVLDDADTLGHTPRGGRAKKWISGAALPALIVLYAVVCLKPGETEIIGRRGSSVARGPAATALAISYMALALFFHFHLFWGLTERLEPYAERLKIIALVVFLGGFLFGISRHLGII